MRRLTVLALTVTLTACGGGGGSTDSTPDEPARNEATSPPGENDEFVLIEVTGIAFPSLVTVPAGKAPKWLNSSGVDHTVTFETFNGAPSDVEIGLGSGAEAGLPLQSGTWAYFCSIHPSMRGTLEVEG